jgi:hypothetical protein
VDLIYNGLSDRYEILYPYLPHPENEGGMKLLTKDQLGDKKVSMSNAVWMIWPIYWLGLNSERDARDLIPVLRSRIIFMRLVLQVKILMRIRRLRLWLLPYCTARQNF